MEVVVLIIIAAGVWYWWSQRKQASQNLEQLMKDNMAEIAVFKDKINQFKLTTFDWVHSNIGPIETLPKETNISLAMYMVDASSAACKYAGVDAKFHNGYGVSLLVAMGYREGQALGMMQAMATPAANPGADLTFGQGSSGFSAWVRDGDAAAHDHIRDAMANWQSASNIADEIAAYGNQTARLSDGVEQVPEQPFEKYRDKFIEEIKRLDPPSAANSMHWLEFTDDEGTRRAYRDGVDPKKLAEIVLRNSKITDIK